MKMMACVVREGGLPQPFADSKPISVEEVTLDGPGPGEVLVKVGGAGLCHSDLSILNGDRQRGLPMVIGHEGAGEVVELGSGVDDIKIGDHVVFQFSASCGRCRRCLEGRPQICERAAASKAKGQLMSGAHRLRDADGNVLNHHSGVSCFAEYNVLDRGSIVVVDPSLPFKEAAIFGCAVMTGAGAVLNTARIRFGDSVAIVGLGGVGLNGLLGAKLAGAGTIVAIDLSDDKLGLARQLGATHTVNATDPDHVEQVRDITSGGVDFAFDLAGTIKAMETAYACTRYGGSIVTAGLSPSGAKFSFEQGDLVGQEKSIRGSYMGSCVPVRDIPRFIDLYQQGRLPVDRLVDRTIGLDEVNAGFDQLQANTTVRQICLPHGGS
ncbi:MAG: alcohol dehydrogenase [Gammaproteobacteria bacterium]|jgi:alcohol dehydrogenase